MSNWRNNVIKNIETPPNLKFPGLLIKKWEKELKSNEYKSNGVKKVYELGDKVLKKWGAFKSVSQAANHAKNKNRHGRCLIVEAGDLKGKKKIVLVGKGIIFDSGGMDLKTYGQDEMKEDMAGIAYMYGLIKKLAKDPSKVLEKTKWHIIVILPMVVNAIGADATLPGSVVKAFNGKTIEVINTDAEGRLVLADALSWASKKFEPSIILDVATLTGSVEYITSMMGAVAMGHLNETREREFIKMIHENDDKDRCLWMPIWKEYKYLLKSDVADLRNIAIKKARADTMLAGLFLSEFVDPKSEWIHIDIGSVPNKGWGLNGIYNWILKNINNK